MARFISQAKKGYYKTPEHLVADIAAYLVCPETEHVKMLDPCAGEGEALHGIGTHLGLAPSQLYANELDEARAETCRSRGLVTLCGDCCNELHASFQAFQCLYLNPPYDEEGNGEGRTEFKFLCTTRQLSHKGVLIFVIPLKILLQKAAIYRFTQSYHNIRVFKFPDKDFAAFGQCVLIANKGRGDLDTERNNMLQDLKNPPILGECQDMQWIIPKGHEGAFYYYSSQLTETLIENLLNTSSAQKELSFGLAGAAHRECTSLMPLRAGHQAVILATGLMDGVFTEPETGNLLVITGKTETRETVSKSTEYCENCTKDITRIRKVPTPIVTAFDLTASMAEGEIILYNMR